MSAEVTNQQGHFFNEKQKEIKQKIMEDLIISFFGNIEENHCYFPTIQEVMDLFMSVLFMFNRDVLVHTFHCFNLEHMRKDIMKNLFETIKEEVNKKVRLGMM